MLNNIAKQQFLELLALSKQMKKNIITIKNDRILGSDETCSTLSVIHYDYMDKFNEYASSGIMEVTFVLNEVVAFLKSYDLLSPNITVDMYGIYDINTGVGVPNNAKYGYELNRMENSCFYYMATIQPSCSGVNMREDPVFNDILGMKKKDGAKMYLFQDQYFMSTFSTIHPVTKSDKIEVETYDIDKHSYLARFIISKKGCTIEEFIRYRNL